MVYKKTVQGVDVGDRVRARYDGQALADAEIGNVVVNNEKQCIILRDDGLTVTIFGDQRGNEGRRWPSLIVEKV